MKAILLLILTLSINSIYSQTENKNPETLQSSVTDVKTESKSGNKTSNNNNKGGNKFYEYVATRIVPPTDPNFVGGKMIVDFVVKTDGSLAITKINNDLGYGISEQITEIFKNCKKWTPAMKDGKPIEVKFSMPITIQGRQN